PRRAARARRAGRLAVGQHFAERAVVGEHVALALHALVVVGVEARAAVTDLPVRRGVVGPAIVVGVAALDAGVVDAAGAVERAGMAGRRGVADDGVLAVRAVGALHARAFARPGEAGHGGAARIAVLLVREARAVRLDAGIARAAALRVGRATRDALVVVGVAGHRVVRVLGRAGAVAAVGPGGVVGRQAPDASLEREVAF